MKRLPSMLVLSLGTLALLLGSCSSPSQQGREGAEKKSDLQESQAPRQPRGPKSEKAKQPDQPLKPQTVAGLIPATDPDQQRQKIKQNKGDPFALIPVKPTVEQIPLPAPPKIPQFRKPLPPLPLPPQSRPPRRPVPPPLPSPELARQVAVLGVIEIGESSQIIVKAPNEQFTRYVEPGQYIAGGQVLVKRVEKRPGLGPMAGGAQPMVVLEEFGQEIYKAVGDGIPQPTPVGQKTAAAFWPIQEE